MIRLLLLAAALLVAPVPARAQTQPTAGEQRQLNWAVQRGRLLFEIDRAAWVTTDDLQEQVRDPAAAGVRGWVVERDSDGYVVTYYAGEGEARTAVYRGRVANRRVVSREVYPAGSRPPLTAFQRRLADAQAMVARMDLRACIRSPFNSAVIPPDTADGPIDVYALTPQTRADHFPFGGHFRATLSASGEIVSQRAFTNSCMDMPMPPPEARAEALGITHLLDETPTEIHVFLSIWTGMPIWVATNQPERIWTVRPDRIELMDTSGAR